MAKRTFKTSKQLTINKTYRKWEDFDMGDVVIGKVIGNHIDQYGKDCPVIEVLDAQFKKDSAKFQGKNLVLNSCGMLSKAMKDANVQLGELIQVEYKGTSNIEKGPFKGKDAHVMDIQIVEEDTGEEELTEDDDSGL